MPGASNELIREAERQLAVSFPSDYRRFVATTDGLSQLFGEAWLMLYPVEELAGINAAYDHSDSHPGLVFIGSDGGGEGVGFDFRTDPPPVVMVNFVSSGWDDAVVQASSFSEFIEQRERGERFKFGLNDGGECDHAARA